MLFAPAWPTWGQAGGHPMLLVTISLGGIPSPQGMWSCLIPHLAEDSSALGLSFSFCTLILSSATSTPVPSPVPNPAADAPALLASILDIPAFQIPSPPSADSFPFVTSALQLGWMGLQFVVQISLLHSAALFHISQASRTALRSFTSHMKPQTESTSHK